MTFSKLDSGITKSSLWSEALHVRIVFVSFLAEKDDTGFVSGSRSGMIRICNVTPEQFDDAIKVLSSPDYDSRTKDFDGRRIEAVEGGWIVINHEKYRLPEREKKESHAEYMRNWRKNKECESVNSREFTSDHNVSPSVSVSVSVSDSVSSEEDSKEKQLTESEKTFDIFREKYPGSKRGLKTEYEYFVKKTRNHKVVLPLLLSALNNQIAWRIEMKNAGMFVPEWKNLKTWIFNSCWEDEKPIIEKKLQQQNMYRQPEQKSQEPHYRRV